MDRAVFVYTTFPSLVEAEAAARVIVGQKRPDRDYFGAIVSSNETGPTLRGWPGIFARAICIAVRGDQ